MIMNDASKVIAQAECVARSVPFERLNGINSILGADAEYCGTFKSDKPDGGIKVDAALEGSIHFTTGGTVHIGPRGSMVKGSIHADYVFIEGQLIDVTIHARKVIEVFDTAKIRGDITYEEALDVHRMARIKGRIECTKDTD